MGSAQFRADAAGNGQRVVWNGTYRRLCASPFSVPCKSFKSYMQVPLECTTMGRPTGQTQS